MTVLIFVTGTVSMMSASNSLTALSDSSSSGSSRASLCSWFAWLWHSGRSRWSGQHTPNAIWIPATLAYPLPPIAVGIAVLHYRLYDIDRIVNRAIVYGSLTAILAGIFAAATWLTQRFLGELTGPASDATIVLTTWRCATLTHRFGSASSRSSTATSSTNDGSLVRIGMNWTVC